MFFQINYEGKVSGGPRVLRVGSENLIEKIKII